MNKKLTNGIFVFLVTLIALSNTSYADSQYTNAMIEFKNLRINLPPSVARSTVAYGEIRNNTKNDDTLISIDSNAGMVMLHQTEIKNSHAQMNHIDNFVIEAGESLILKPMSYHLMFMNIDHNIVKENGTAELSFKFQKAGVIKVMVPITTD